MRERLREIPDLPPHMEVVFLREQADVVAEREQALEQGGCFGVAVLQRVIVGKPEAAGKKYAFSRREPVDPGLSAIPEHEAIDHEFLLDGGKGTAHAHPMIGISSRLASSSLLPKLCVNVLRLPSNPCAQMVACTWSRS